MSRLPRSSLFYVLLVIVLGVVFYITWNTLENQNRQTWSYYELLSKADDHQVKSVEIKGSEAIARDLKGTPYDVHLSDGSNDQLTQKLYANQVPFSFAPAAAPTGSRSWCRT